MIALSMDLDWAPDWAVRHAVDVVRDAGLAITLFVTNDTPALSDLRDDPRVELGWHPNYMPNSSHGDTPNAVLDHMTGLVPEAKGVRSHGLWRGTSFVVQYHERGMRYEASDLLFLQPGTTGGRYWNGVAQLPIWWEDDVQMLYQRPMRIDAVPLATAPPLAVMNFHPILIALNSATLDGYQGLKKMLNDASRPLSTATRQEVAAFRDDQGAENLLRDVCTWCREASSGHGMRTLHEIAETL